MALIRQYFCIRNVWGLAITLNYINILHPVYFNVFLHGNFLQCTYYIFVLKIYFRFIMSYFLKV